MLSWEKDFLRNMAKEKLELSQTPVMQELVTAWTRHNDLLGTRPMIHFEMGTVGDSGFNYVCQCESEDARNMEMRMGNEMANHKMVADDRVVTDDFFIGKQTQMQPFGLECHRTNTEGVGFHIDPIVEDLDSLDFIKPSIMTFDEPASKQWKEQVEDVLGDILNVQWGMDCIYITPTQFLVNIMGMENLYVSMYDNPDNFHQMMQRLSDDYITYIRKIESMGLLLPNNGNNWVGQGTYAFTSQLPSIEEKGEHNFKLNDVWGFMDSQETVNISPAMFHEFIFPYYKRVSDHFGLLSYGCCEPVHSFWEQSLSQLKNLRKISISPWCDEEYMGAMLRGSNVIYQRKPAPQFIGVDVTLDETAFREHIKKTIHAARGCKLEITFRDTYSLGGQLEKPRRAVEIVREVIATDWE